MAAAAIVNFGKDIISMQHLRSMSYSQHGNRFSKFKKAAATILNFSKYDAIVALYVEVSKFPPNLVRIGPKVRKWQPFSKFKMATAAILNFGNYAFLMQQLRSMSDFQHSHQI